VAAFAAWSDSQTAFGDGLRINGKGVLYGLRYVMSLPPAGQWGHSLTLGLDLKDFNETLGFRTGADAVVTPITYLPLSASYGATLPDPYGVSRLSAGVNLAFRHVVADQREFEVKRFKALGNYIYATAGIERVQKLPLGMDLFVKVDGQIADQPLIANEQYVAGGMENVRGYKESEEAGDDALHTTVEIGGPQWALPVKGLFSVSADRPLAVKPYGFFDAAALRIQYPLPEQDPHKTVSGAGCGIRGSAGSYLEWVVEWATALESTSRTPSGHQRIHFKVKAMF
jgi:hemolysin activation/secretion protein